MLASRDVCLPYATAKPGASTEVCHPLVGSLSATMDCSLDMERLSTAIRRLHACGFYYEGLTLMQAGKLLEPTPVGTFLVRDSADSRYLFSLSVQTERGPTSVRIHYVNGEFRLDAEASLLNMMPTFECVIQLVDFYVRLSQTEKSRAHVWLDQNGRRDLHIRLSRPLYRRVSSLQHLTRTLIMRHVPVQRVDQLPIPTSLKGYIRDYPYPQ